MTAKLRNMYGEMNSSCEVHNPSSNITDYNKVMANSQWKRPGTRDLPEPSAILNSNVFLNSEVLQNSEALL